MLHDLVVLKKSLLDAYDSSHVQEEVLRLRTEINNIKAKVPSIENQNLEYIDSLTDYCNKIIEFVKQPDDNFRNKIREIEDNITVVSHELFANNYELEERDGGIDNVRANRKLHMPQEVQDLVKQRIYLHVNWQYPTLEIGCRDGEWTQELIAADPLYIIDKYQEFLDATDSLFPERFQQRMRKYKLGDYNFAPLPQGQFGFIFSWNHFNYVSLDTITEVLKKIKGLLRPGGTFMFSYNDGDTPAGAGMAESRAQSYIPQSILVPTCQSLGFEVSRSFNEGTNISWLEIKLPGTLKTIKAHQVLGKIQRRMT
jgi:SAM-dependent methyltransferase